MDFDWTTFALEIINFLVLVWLLHRFLYRPVLAVVEARRTESLQTLERAAREQQDAAGLTAEYQDKLAAWETARAAALARLDEEVAAERATRLAALDKTLDAERERRAALAARADEERLRALEAQAVRAAAAFATRFLERLAGPELEARLADLALEDLHGAPAELSDKLRPVLDEAGTSIRVVSAHPLDAQRRAAFTRSLSELAGKAVTPEFIEDATLKAGVCVMAGAWVLAANLRDELGFFTRLSRDENDHGPG